MQRCKFCDTTGDKLFSNHYVTHSGEHQVGFSCRDCGGFTSDDEVVYVTSKTDTELLNIALEMLSAHLESCIHRNNLEQGYEHFKTHCIKCNVDYDEEYLSTYGMCSSCYGKMVGVHW